VRAHLLGAMVAIALTSVAVTGVLVTRAVDAEMRDFTRRDLRFSAANAAEMAAAVYVESGGWTARSVRAVRTVARSRGDVVAVLGPDERPLTGSPAPPGPGGVRAPVRVAGRRVGTVVATHPGAAGAGGAAARLDRHLSTRTDNMLLESGVVAGVLALLASLVVAVRMARPLHRLTEAARRMEAGEIETRAAGSGGGREITGLARTMDRLAAALCRQDDLRRATVADVTHELRGALVGMVARIETLQDGTVPDEGAVLRQMEGDIVRMRRLISDVNRLADAQLPGLLMNRRPVDLAEIVRARVAACADKCRARSITLTQHLTPACVEGDPERLAQVLDNLLANALRYTDPGGRVTVRAGVRGGEAFVEVADSGIGIAPEHIGRIFDRFWRAPGARERASDGSGVGLAVVSEIVRAHSGRVEVSSHPGRGSVFTMALPPARGVAVPAPTVHQPVAGGLAREPRRRRGGIAGGWAGPPGAVSAASRPAGGTPAR
jgi:two-component system, OmpR family, sensor histidine kinase BaeS